MKLFYGNYTALEEKFISYALQERKNPLDKWLVVCASSLMRESLQKKLARQNGVIANIHFISGSGLMSRLDAEAGGTLLPLLPQDNLRDFILKDLLEAPDLKRYRVTRGFLRSVKSSLRDLADSCVLAQALEEYEQNLPDDALVQDRERFRWLVRLYKRYEERENNIAGFRSYQNAYERALSVVGDSPFLRSFSQIIIYGFYDLPGRQWDLISRVTKEYEGAVFAPYEKLPAYKFAERFFETNWLPNSKAQALSPLPCALGQGGQYLFAPAGSAPTERVSVISALNKEEEVSFTAKEILRLHDACGIAFGDMAVVVRTAAEYQQEVLRSFKQHGIALDASFTYPLTHYALGRFCLRLFALAGRGFAREEVLALVSSPYFKHAHKAQWCGLIRRCLVKRDLNQWRDLLPNTVGYEEDFLLCLEDISQYLVQLGPAQPWVQGVKLAQELLTKYVNTDCFEGKDSEIYASICETLSKLERYALVRATSKEGELLVEINDAFNALVFNETEQSVGGVTFTDAIRARGLRFKVVFILGLNDKSFPLVTPEDPLLRDYYRYIVRDVLGGTINGSLERADEEKLLFYAAAGSAQEQLYVLYSRQKSDGKPAIASLYLTELSRACELGINWGSEGLYGGKLRAVSGNLKTKLTDVHITLWTPKELSYAFILAGGNVLENYVQAGMADPQKEQSLKAGEALSNHGDMSAFDGFIQSGEDFFRTQNEKGFSPSSLQTLASCPLKYFFDKGLYLGREEDLLSRDSLASNLRGNIYHKILQDFYQTLAQKHITHELFNAGLLQILQENIDKNLQKQNYRRYGIYPLLWEFIIRDISQALLEFVPKDIAAMGNFTPTYFETERFTAPTAQLPLHLHGYPDRIDIDEKNKLLRIIDYKSNKKSATKDLNSTFFKSLIFQPFLYLFMILHDKLGSDYVPESFALMQISPFSNYVYTMQQYEAVFARAIDFLKQLTAFIKAGTFFICPQPREKAFNNSCSFCAYKEICRRDHFTTLQRVKRSPQSKMLKELRQ